jgi:hypothetical protein
MHSGTYLELWMNFMRTGQSAENSSQLRRLSEVIFELAILRSISQVSELIVLLQRDHGHLL